MPVLCRDDRRVIDRDRIVPSVFASVDPAAGDGIDVFDAAVRVGICIERAFRYVSALLTASLRASGGFASRPS